MKLNSAEHNQGSGGEIAYIDPVLEPTWTEADERLMRSVDPEISAAVRASAVDQARQHLEQLQSADLILPADLYEQTSEKSFAVQIGQATASEKPNEDSSAASPDGWAVVCDGVGSADSGGEGAQTITNFLAQRLANINSETDHALAEKEITAALLEADELLNDAILTTGESKASTASVLKLIQEGDKTYAVFGNVGDSPIYIMRQGELQELVGHHLYLPPREMRPALGKLLNPNPVVFSVPLQPGDRLLLSTNGIRKNTDNRLKPIQKILTKNSNPQAAAHKLVTKLNKISPDARTAVVMDIK